jgi:hypothetical protein
MTATSNPGFTGRVLLLVLIAFLPAAGIYWFANREIRALQLTNQEQELLRATRETSVEYNRLLEESRVLLATLAEFPPVSGMQQPDCTQILGRVFDQANHLNGIWAIGLDGYVGCGSVQPDGLLYLGDRTYYIRAMNENRHVIGNYQIGRVTGRPGVGSAIPIRDDNGMPGGVLIASIDLRALSETAQDMEMPESATFTVLDRQGRILVRYPSGLSEGDTIGAMRTEGFPETADEPGIVHGADLDGSMSVFAVAPLTGEGATPEGYIAIGRPEGVISSEASDVVNDTLGLVAIAALALLTAAWIFGRYIIAKPSSSG